MAWYRQLTDWGRGVDRLDSYTELLSPPSHSPSSPSPLPLPPASNKTSSSNSPSLLPPTSPNNSPTSSPYSSPSSTLPSLDSPTRRPSSSSLRHDLSRQETLEEDKFSYCPSSWYRAAKEEGGWQGSWRLAFLCLCLPLCYPCYLSRSARIYRRRRRPRPARLEAGRETSVDREASCLSPSPQAKETTRVVAMFLQSTSSLQLANQLALQGVALGQGLSGQVEVTVGATRAEVTLAFEAIIGEGLVKDPTPQLDVLVLTYREESEVVSVLSRAGGVMRYCAKYWRGYYPLLLLRLDGSTESIHLKKDTLALIERNFSWCHMLQLSYPITKREETLVMSSLLQLYLHMFRLRCDPGPLPCADPVRLPGQGDWTCPGHCGLATQQLVVESKQGGGKKGAVRRAARRILNRTSQEQGTSPSS